MVNRQESEADVRGFAECGRCNHYSELFCRMGEMSKSINSGGRPNSFLFLLLCFQNRTPELFAVFVTAGSTALQWYSPSGFFFGVSAIALAINMLFICRMVFNGRQDNLKLLDDMALLKPTIFCSVPRLYNRVYDGVMNAVKSSGGLREELFNAAYNAKRQELLKGKKASPMWDRLVFDKIKAKCGERVRFMVSGASPLSANVIHFLKV
ncbi:putative long-chain-fatty-acid--CoA ligase [Helianthus annuus]|nr:putative long-chain-fatty-acid--CoA ligase [Helianthus annuus]